MVAVPVASSASSIHAASMLLSRRANDWGSAYSSRTIGMGISSSPHHDPPI
jgi:hypothetical protein